MSLDCVFSIIKEVLIYSIASADLTYHGLLSTDIDYRIVQTRSLV